MTAPGDSPPITPSPRRSPARTIPLLIGLGMFLVGSAWLVRRFYVAPLTIPQSGMVPTLVAGDRIFVRKDAYGMGEHRSPARGDLVVFRDPEHPAQDLVQRVIGLPGDTIMVQDGAVFINGWRIPTCVAGIVEVNIGEGNRSGFGVLELLGETAYLVFHDPPKHGHDEETEGHSHRGESAGPYTVSDHEVFVLGDNREHTQDSRHWFEGRGGGVRFDEIKGRATTIWMSGQNGKLVWSRRESNLTGAPQCPQGFPPAACEAIERCLANRPPADQTRPPASQRAGATPPR